MSNSSRKSSKKGASVAFKSLAQEIEDGHNGNYNPSEKTVQSTSSSSQSASNEDSYDPNATRTHQSYSSDSEASKTDPTGHSGDYNPSAK